jgi:hypothetical protein
MKDRILETDYVKKVVENLAGIEDISVKSRKAYIVKARYIYMELCMTFKSRLYHTSLDYIGKTINRDHATVLHGLKKFDYDNLYELKIYKEALIDIKDYLQLKIDDKEFNDDRIRIYYRTKHIELSDKYRSVINSLRDKLNTYRENEFIDRLARLDTETLKEAEVKFDAFLKVKQAMKR